MRLTRQQKIRMYSHYDHYLDAEDDFWPIMGIFFTILAVWTGVVHLIDWLTFDAIPIWLEPFTIIPLVFLIVMRETYDSVNPLYWWPMIWGYTARLPDEDVITIRPLQKEEVVLKYGGPLNVHVVDNEHIKFRRQKDAVVFGLTKLTF